MNHHDATQAWRDQLKARKQRPDPNDRIVVRGGEEWARTWPKACPICGDRFYTFGPAGELPPPPRAEPVPEDDSKRETCGHPFCWRAEDDEAAKRSSAASKAMAEVKARIEQDRRRAEAQEAKNRPGAGRGALAPLAKHAPTT